MKVILDNGHGRDTAGKRSPDGRLREYAYTREMARRIAQDLKRQGIDVSLLVPEDTDVPLKERVERANRIYAETGKQAILVSIHVNAAGNGSTWFSARGWSVFVDPAASQDSERLATSIAEAAGNIGLTVRRETGGRNYWVSSLYICKHTNCPAVLTENLFQDNREDVDYLLSDAGKQAIVRLHVKGIIDYLNPQCTQHQSCNTGKRKSYPDDCFGSNRFSVLCILQRCNWCSQPVPDGFRTIL